MKATCVPKHFGVDKFLSEEDQGKSDPEDKSNYSSTKEKDTYQRCKKKPRGVGLFEQTKKR